MIYMIKSALFDLDGTLVDTSVDLGRATAFVLESYGVVPKWNDSDYRAFVGNGARKLIDRAFEHTLSDDKLDKALALFKEKYNEILLDNACLYDGVKASLDFLKQNEIKLAVVTNKPHEAALIMVESLFGKGYFDVIVGAKEDKPKKPNPYSVHLALEKLECRAENAIYFGDSDIDVFTAKNAGVKGIACSWGYRDMDCLLAASPAAVIDSASDIIRFL